MPGGELAGLQEFENGRRQAEEPDAVGYRGAPFAYPMGYLLLGQTVLINEVAVGRGFLQGSQIFPLEVLDERLCENGGLIGLSQHGRYTFEACQLCGPPATLT